VPASYSAPVGESLVDIIRQQAMRDLAQAGYNMSLAQFCDALGYERDDYARRKFVDFQEIGRLLGHFDDHTLQALVHAYKAR
jgi:hypothetical protein